MEDKPATALRKKRDCSIARAAELVRQGRADAVVSVGNTGGIFAASTLRIGRISGVDRGGIATVIPTPDSQFVLLDAGANVECRPINLVQYAVMGSVYAREILGLRSPRVGILNVGTEDGKGNDLSLEAFQACSPAIEGDVFEHLGAANVVGRYASAGAAGPAQVARQSADWKKHLAQR